MSSILPWTWPGLFPSVEVTMWRFTYLNRQYFVIKCIRLARYWWTFWNASKKLKMMSKLNIPCVRKKPLHRSLLFVSLKSEQLRSISYLLWLLKCIAIKNVSANVLNLWYIFAIINVKYKWLKATKKFFLFDMASLHLLMSSQIFLYELISASFCSISSSSHCNSNLKMLFFWESNPGSQHCMRRHIDLAMNTVHKCSTVI